MNFHQTLAIELNKQYSHAHAISKIVFISVLKKTYIWLKRLKQKYKINLFLK